MPHYAQVRNRYKRPSRQRLLRPASPPHSRPHPRPHPPPAPPPPPPPPLPPPPPTPPKPHREEKGATAQVARPPGAKGAKAVKTAAPSPRRRGEGERSSGTKPAITPVIAPARKHARA